MSIKIVIHIELDDYPEKVSKIQVPKSWLEKEVKDVINLFVKGYNDKNIENKLELSNIHLQTKDKQQIYSNEIVKNVLEDREDYYIKFGSYEKEIIKEDVIDTTNMIRCRNYGCNRYYKEEENTETSCQHHCGPPIFHDTYKYWSCCTDKKVYDFDSFQQIVGCSTGKHSSVPKQVAISASPNATIAEDGTAIAQSTAQPVLKSIASYNNENPDAASSLKTAIKSTIRKSSRSEDGLSAKCQRKGCQQTFLVAENSENACTYHKGQPIFHDAVKFWGCCHEKKCFDFDEFLAVPGCASGFHDDGVIELN